MSAEWNAERLAKLSLRELETLRSNAERLHKACAVALCDEEIEKRTPRQTPKKHLSTPKKKVTHAVAGYPFVCCRDLGVIESEAGQFWSGTWKVSEENARKSIRLAFLEHKDEPSYRQGRIVDYRLGERDMVDKENTSIDFLVEPTAESYEWVGEGSGEKGYRWTQIASTRVGFEGVSS